jgi:hypothetical protein
MVMLVARLQMLHQVLQPMLLAMIEMFLLETMLRLMVLVALVEARPLL